MAVEADFGIFDCPASTGVTAVVTSLSFTPKAYILWGTVVTGESVAIHAADHIGMTDGTNQFSIQMSDEDGSTDTRRDVGTSPDRVLQIIDPTEAHIVYATHSSFNADGFSLNFGAVVSGIKIHWLALGGDGINNVAVNSVVANTSPETGVGFEPDFLFAFCAGLNLTGNPSQHSCHGFGVADGTNEWWLGTYNSDNNDDNKDSLLYTDAFIGQQYNGSRTWQLTLTSFDVDGFTWGGSNSDGFYYMAIDSGGSMSCNDFTKVASPTASQDLPDAGFTPGMYMLASGSEVDEVINTDNGSSWSVGITDGSNEQHCYRTSPTDVSNSDQRQDNDNLLMVGKSGDAVPDATASASAISDQTPTITWSPNDANEYIIGVWYIETEVGVEDYNVDEQEDIAVTDVSPTLQITAEGEYSVSEQEDITVGESVSLSPVSPHNIGVQDAVTVVDVFLPYGDTVAVGEYTELLTSVSDVYTISVSDGITVGETTTSSPVTPTEIGEQEDITVGEATTLDLALAGIAEQEDVTVGESTTLTPVSPTEIGELDAITVGETTTLSPVYDINITELDAVTVGEAQEVVRTTISDYSISEVDPVTVGDSAALSPVYDTDIAELDAVTVGESTDAAIAIPGISETEPITVGDTTALAPVYDTEISETEPITVGDTPNVIIPVIGEWYVSETDGVTVGDAANVQVSAPADLALSEADGVTVGDTPAVNITAVADLSILEADNVTVGELPTVSIFKPTYTLVVSDAILVGELVRTGMPGLGPDPVYKRYRDEFPPLPHTPTERPKAILTRMDRLNTAVQEREMAELEAAEESLAQERRVQRVDERQRVEKEDFYSKQRKSRPSLINLEKAKERRTENLQKQADLQRAREKNLKKARAKLRSNVKKKMRTPRKK